MVIVCKACGKKTPEGKLCQICGAFLAPPVQCPGCGRTTAAGTPKCAYCGAAIVPVKAAELVACPKCARKMAAHLAACQMCGTPLAAARAAAGITVDPMLQLTFGPAVEKALELARANQFKEALPFLDRALSLQANADVWAIKGGCLHNLGRYGDALPCYREAVKFRPDDPSLLTNMGNTLRLMLRFEEAATAYERAARLNPLNPEFQANYALLLRELGRYGEAIPACHAVLAAKPDAPPFLNCLGFCLFGVGKADQAQAPLRRAAEADPKRSFYWIDLGLCLEALRKQDEADACFEKAGQMDSISARPNFYRALLLERRGAKPDAAEHFYRATVGFLLQQRQHPLGVAAQHEHQAAREGLQRLRAHLVRTADPDALFAQARQAEGEGLWDDALGLYEEVLVFAPENRDAVEGAARMKLARKGEGKIAEAAKAPMGREDEVRAAERLAHERKPQEALAHLEKAIAIDPEVAEAWCGKGQALLMLERPADALPCFEKALRLNPEYRQALGGLGESLIHVKRFKEAEPVLVRCLEKKPDDAKVQMYLARAREMTGQKQAAFEGYARFLWVVTSDQKEHLQFARQQHKELLDSLRPAIPKLPSSGADKWHEKAFELMKRGRLQEAVLAFDGALKADPYDVGALLNRGQCLTQLGRAEEALKSFDQGVKLAPKLPAGWLMRSGALESLDRTEEGLKSVEKALELDAFESSSWGNKGALLNALGRPAEALPCLERALILNPFNPVAWYNRGCTEKALNQPQAATKSLKRFLEILPQGMEDQVETARSMLRELETGKPQDATPVVTLEAKPQRVLGNNFEIYRELGRGGFGVVYLALERKRQEVCALKTFLDERAADPESIRMFKAEAKTWIDLDVHPHLVRAYYVDEIDGRLYLAMELIAPGPDGCNTLEAYLRTKPPGLAQSLRWAIQFCHGMEYAYTKGIRCHRDIKPANIMIDGRKKLKISDFGLAAAVTAKPGASPLQLRCGNVGLSIQGEGGGAGTPTHMPPEQWRSAAACDERSDLYAFGVTLYQMASKGRLPFLPPLPRTPSPQEEQRFLAELRTMHVQAAPAPLPSPLWPLIERCLRKNPAERYRSFRELRADLEPLLKGEAQGESVPAPEIGKLDAGDLVNKAHSLDALGRAEEALKTFDAALKLDPNAAIALEGKGFVLARIGRLPEALAAFDQAIALDPSSATGHATKASSLMMVERFRDALAGYDRAIELDGRNAITWRNKARCLQRMGRSEEALKTFEHALTLDPDSAVGWGDKGDVLRLLGRHPEAIEALKKSLAINPSHANALNLMGESLIATGRHAEAVASFDRAVAIDPTNYSAWVNRGGCLAAGGRFEDAMASYDRAIPLDPVPSMAWNNKGDLYVRMKQPQKAMECFDRALQAEPNMALAVQNKALRYRDLGRIDDGLAILEQGLKAHPDHSGLWYFKGEFHVMKKQLEPAIAAYQKVLETEKSNARALAFARCHMGECYEKLGNKADALIAFGQALQILPSYKEALEGSHRALRMK